MYPITSYKDAASEVQAFIDEADEQAEFPPYQYFMAPWTGEDAKRLCGVDYTVFELVGFLDGYGMDNTYITSETAQLLNEEFGIEFLHMEF